MDVGTGETSGTIQGQASHSPAAEVPSNRATNTRHPFAGNDLIDVELGQDLKLRINFGYSVGPGMKVKVQAWGNSLGLRIPKAYASELGVRPGSEMELNVQAGALLARVAETIDLNALLAEITAENKHGECDWGEASGGEAW